MIRRRTYTKGFKESAIELYSNHSNEKTTKEIADELGIHQENLCRWLRESKEGEKNNLIVFPGQGTPRDEGLARLKKENAGLRETNETLKKATAFFVVKNPR
jgi:transposase